MTLTMVDVEKVNEEFVNEFMFQEPYSEYINMVGISTVAIQSRPTCAPWNEDPQPELCLSVGLRKELPEDISLPDTYKGVKVFVKVVGEFRPLKL